jgi:hypothetical protein
MWALALLVALSPDAPTGIAVVSSVQVGSAGRTTGFEVEADLLRAIRSRPSLRAESITALARHRIAACGASVSCMAAALARDGYALGLRVAADQRFTPAVFTAQLIDAETGRVVDELVGEVASDQTLREVLDARVGALLERAGHPRLGRLTLYIDPPGASVRVEPAPVVGEGGEYWVTEGDYRVLAPDGTAWPVRAEAGRISVLRVGVSQPAEASSPWLWIAIVAAVAAGAAASIGIAAASASDTSCVCLAAPGSTCPPCP